MIRILVVDDHKLVRNGLCKFLETQLDMVVMGSADNGQIALNLLNNGLKVDLMLTDLNMPLMDGLELTQKAIVSNPDLRVIVLSMHSSFNINQRALDAGAIACLSKGNEQDLLLLIRSAIEPSVLVSNLSSNNNYELNN